jgi:hypothetical protein
MFKTDSSEVLEPEESYRQIKESVEKSEMPDWVAEEMEKLWENPEDFESADSLDQELMDSPLYMMFRLGVGFGTEYEREYPTDGDWRSDS